MKLRAPHIPPQEPNIKQIKPRKASPFGKYIYLLIILLSFSGLGKWGFDRFFCVQAPATLSGNEIKIESPIKAAIESLDLKIGDKVEKGAPLINLNDVDLQEKISQQKGEIQRLEAQEEKERKLLYTLIDEQTNKNNLAISQAQAKREELLGQIEVSILKEKTLREKKQKLDELFQKTQKLFILNGTTRSRYLESEIRLKDCAGELETVASEIKTAEKRLKFIDEEISMLMKAGSELSSSITSKSILPVLSVEIKSAKNKLAIYENSLQTHTLRSPLAGIVTQIYKKQGEIIMPGEPLLKIIDPESVFVKAYFSQKDESFLHTKDNVELLFDNGRLYMGKINKFYPSTDTFPPEFREYYQPDQQAIVAEIIPYGNTWPLTLGMGVRVQKKRF